MGGESLLEYGVLGACVLALSATVWKFILVRMSSENDSLRAEIADVRRRYDALLSQQISDYSEIASSYAENSAKTRAAVNSATDTIKILLDHVSKEEE